MPAQFVIPAVEDRPEWVREFAEPADLAAEAEVDKALRMLRMMRAFVAAPDRLMILMLDEVPIMFAKCNEAALLRDDPVEGAL